MKNFNELVLEQKNYYHLDNTNSKKKLNNIVDKLVKIKTEILELQNIKQALKHRI